MVSSPNLFLVVLFSLVPGLAHLYIKKVRKGASLLFISGGIVLTLALSHSAAVRVLMAFIYLVTVVPSAMEVWQTAYYGRQTFDIYARWYVVLMLWLTGFSAVPLLWQSPRFSRPAKIALTLAVAFMAVLFFTLLVYFWNFLNDFLDCFLSRRCGY